MFPLWTFSIHASMKNLPFIIFLALYALVGLYLLVISQVEPGQVPYEVEEFMVYYLMVVPPVAGLLVLAEFIILAHPKITRTNILPLLISLLIWIPTFLLWLFVMLFAWGLEDMKWV